MQELLIWSSTWSNSAPKSPCFPLLADTKFTVRISGDIFDPRAAPGAAVEGKLNLSAGFGARVSDDNEYDPSKIQRWLEHGQLFSVAQPNTTLKPECPSGMQMDAWCTIQNAWSIGKRFWEPWQVW